MRSYQVGIQWSSALSNKNEAIRQFNTGATRDTAEGKLYFSRFESALVSKRFAQYMDKNRVQSDGNLREPDNWKKGIPEESYFESLDRHMKDLELIKEGFPREAREDIESALCAIIFNARGLLYEILKRQYKSKEPITTTGPVAGPGGLGQHPDINAHIRQTQATGVPDGTWDYSNSSARPKNFIE